MIQDALLADLERRGVRLTARDNRLRVEAPPGVVTPDLLDQLRAHKPELLRLLTAPPEADDFPLSIRLDPVTVVEVLGSRPDPEALQRVEAEIRAALVKIGVEIQTGVIGSEPALIRGVPLALWLPLEQLARLLGQRPARKSG